MPDNGATILVWIVTTLVPIAMLYFTNKARIKDAEHRQTVLEMTVKHLEEKVEHNVDRLDKHDEQSRATYSLIEQVKHLTASVEEVRRDVKSLTEKG
ncbi:TPA: hypothetical protein TY768_000939 [Streptococcus suis]|nr:hypothetical protein [Streptococcus suis]